METAVCVSGFLLLVFITGAQQLSPEVLFGVVGGHADFDPGDYHDQPGFVSMLFKVSAGEDLLLVDCSQPDRPQPEGYNVKCVQGHPNPQGIRHNTRKIVHFDIVRPAWDYLTMNNLTVPHSGEYRLEVWREQDISKRPDARIDRNDESIGKVKEKNTSRSFHLIVCAEGGEELSVEIRLGGRATLCGMDFTQLYRSNWHQLRTMLVLDTNSSLEPLAEDLRGRLQVDLSTSQVTLSGVRDADYESRFYCASWRKDQCQNVNYIHLDLERPYNAKYVFAVAKENVTLPCNVTGEPNSLVFWDTCTGYGRLTIAQGYPQEVMYMRNNSQHYSLIMPGVTLQHSGRYECSTFLSYGPSMLKNIRLFICTKVSPLLVMFSDDESVCLEETTQNFMKSVHGVQWFRQKFLEPKVLFLDSKQGFSPLIKDLKGRMNVTADYFPIISNLTAEDSGIYTWRVFGQSMNLTWVCSEGSFHLVYRDPFGVHSPFYRACASLMGCGLLGLVASVIWFKLRSSSGEQTSGRQSREGHQHGDDLHEGVEMAEISG